MKNLIVKDNFFSSASQLRGHFVDQFKNPLRTHQQRFVWDYWNVPDQYRLIRTPAYHYFPKSIYQKFHESLVLWGRENLGCHDISPPWLSYYVNGCRQNLHTDVPHGPWAFVYSLSPKQILFEGGETLLLKNEVLDYWKNFVSEKDREQNSFIDRISPKFNRLVVFDPRRPHGVTEVKGVEDPLDARLVIHGWFVEPRPYVQGALSTKDVQSQVGDLVHNISKHLPEFGNYWGTFSLGIQISAGGKITRVKLLTDTLVGLDSQSATTQSLYRWIFQQIKLMKFKSRPKGSWLVIPVLFK